MTREFDQYAKMAAAVWSSMEKSPDPVWDRTRVAHLAQLLDFGPITMGRARSILERVEVEHPGRLKRLPGRVARYEVLPAGETFIPCRSTQHCAHHGWCYRCAPMFAAIMGDVNRAIAETGVGDSFRGPLYDEVAKTLMPYLLDGNP